MRPAKVPSEVVERMVWGALICKEKQGDLLMKVSGVYKSRS